MAKFIRKRAFKNTMKNSKSGLAVELSKLDVFPAPDMRMEQYPTDSEIAAEVLWHACMQGGIEGKTIADLGCGTGVLGIGALLLGAKQVFFIDKDTAALAVLGSNLKRLCITKGFKIINEDIASFDEEVDIVIQNPPFGTKDEHIDRFFLGKAFSLADTVYSFHKTATKEFVEKFAQDSGFKIAERMDFKFPIKNTMAFHRKRIQRIEVSCFRFEKA
jgi:putative methylase